MKLTEVMAVYGAVLSTLTFLLTVFRARPRLKVDLIYGTEDDRAGVFVYVRNASSHKVRVESITLLYQAVRISVWRRLIDMLVYRRLYRWHGWAISLEPSGGLSTGCPLTLEPHAAHRFMIPDQIMDRLLEKGVSERVVAKAQDALWKDYYSRPYTAVRYRGARRILFWTSK